MRVIEVFRDGVIMRSGVVECWCFRNMYVLFIIEVGWRLSVYFCLYLRRV